MMMFMASKILHLRRCRDGYYRTAWFAEDGRRLQRSFGNKAEIARSRFSEFYARWAQDPGVRTPREQVCATIRECWVRFEAHAASYYRRADGTATGEAANIALAMEYVLDRYAEMSPAELSPRLLKICREAMAADDLAINTINRWVGKIRQVWRWFAAEEMVAPSVWHGLQAVEPLKAGRGQGRDTEPVRPVPEAHVRAVMAALPETLSKMIELQLLTGMRPGELCRMKAVEIETGGPVWIYRPGLHKSLHRGRERMVLIGPRGQEIVRGRLGRPVAAVLFSPRDTVRDVGRTPHAGIAAEYSKDAYARAVRRGCVKVGAPAWSPNRLRHNAATALRKQFGLDIAQVVLGHSKADVTQVYAELDVAKASAAMEKVG